MAAENPTWGAPRIHGELLKLEFKVSEPTVSRWLQRVPRRPDLRKRWLTFLRKFLIFDRDGKFGNDVICAAKTLGPEPVRTAFRSPWQNGVAERWVRSCRCD